MFYLLPFCFQLVSLCDWAYTRKHFLFGILESLRFHIGRIPKWKICYRLCPNLYENSNYFADCIPGRKSGILRIQYGPSAIAAATTEISFKNLKLYLKNILVRPFKFGMWVYMDNATNTIVL